MKNYKVWVLVLVAALFCLVVFYRFGDMLWGKVSRGVSGKRTVEDVVKKTGLDAEARIKLKFEKVKVVYPGTQVTFIVLKKEWKVELWSKTGEKWVHIYTYPITCISGKAGPKLKEGDLQVPEGVYKFIALNPNSQFHLSIKVNYPNEYDLQKAKKEKRKNLGGDIFMHGKDVSIGCIAIGDPAIEEVFTLVSKIGLTNTKLIIMPNDLRNEKPITDMKTTPAWTPELYKTIEKELKDMK